MEIIYQNGCAIIKGVPFDPDVVFTCGQAFRFNPKGEGYFGIAQNRPLFVAKGENGFSIGPVSQKDVEGIWVHYFDFKLDYAFLEDAFADDVMAKTAIRYCKGMRLLNQDPFETIVSFIISANNHDKRIRGIIEAICTLAGDAVFYEGKRYHAFPSPGQLARVSEDALRRCGAGYRAPYIQKTAAMIADGFDLGALYVMSAHEAKKRLLTLPGVGPKVADCILLFAFDKKQAFPVDVWMRRVLSTCYHMDFQKENEVTSFVETHFGSYAGIVQQCLFHYARKTRFVL